MIRFKLVVLFIITSIFQINAQFNPETAEQSLVKIIVKQTGSKTVGVCTGFIWKDKSWIVTSLHAMKPSGIIQVVYPGGALRTAQVIKVFQKADLVLLKTDIDAKPLSTQVAPLTSFHNGKVAFEEKIYAIGYNGGSKGDQTQSLEKGHANPETLAFLLRPKDTLSLLQIGFPSLAMPIYFLSGSLLPGFSGSPVYNQKNELIGIGDGGLESGMMNVSWCIPANNLDQLENSDVSELPANLSTATALYSAEVSIPLPDENDNSTSTEQAELTNAQINDLSQQADSDYNSYAHGDFDFHQTKSRSWEQMRNTSIDQKNMDQLVDDIEEELKIKVDKDYMKFDIYQDINHNISIAIPENAALKYDDDLGGFTADLDTSDAYANYFNLLFAEVENSNGNATEDVLDAVKKEFDSLVHGFSFNENYTHTQKINDKWSADYRFFMGDSTYIPDAAIGEVNAMFYLNVIHSKDAAFFSLAVCLIPIEDKSIQDGIINGIDCVKNYDGNTDACDYFETLVKVLAAAHLTTISSLH